jgi:hypothetical protein
MTVSKVKSNTAESHVRRLLQNNGMLSFQDSFTSVMERRGNRGLTEEDIILVTNEFRKWYKSDS